MAQIIFLIPNADGSLHFSISGQRFRLKSVHDYTTKAGSKTRLLDIETECHECGKTFVFTTSRRCNPHYFCRTCFETVRKAAKADRGFRQALEPNVQILLDGLAQLGSVQMYLRGGPDTVQKVLHEQVPELASFHPVAIARSLERLLADGDLEWKPIGRNAQRQPIRTLVRTRKDSVFD